MIETFFFRDPDSAWLYRVIFISPCSDGVFARAPTGKPVG
jgi:hypothetical protein